MKSFKFLGIGISLVWVIALILTYTASIYWLIYFIISGIAVILINFLLFNTGPTIYTNEEPTIMEKLKGMANKNLTYDEEEEYYYIVPNKRKRKKRKRRKSTLGIDYRQRVIKDARQARIIINDLTGNIRRKEYLHTTIPDLSIPEKQDLLWDIIQTFKDNHFFTSFYAGITDEDMIEHYDEYKYKQIFELYDNSLPNAYSKLLYDEQTEENRLAIFLSDTDADHYLGFIDFEDHSKAEFLLQKYSNIQVIPTIIGGNFKTVRKNAEGQIEILTQFIDYNLTISLAFYNS